MPRHAFGGVTNEAASASSPTSPSDSRSRRAKNALSPSAIPHFPSPRLAAYPYYRSSPEELAADMALARETYGDVLPTSYRPPAAALQQLPRTPLSPPAWTGKDSEGIIDWVANVKRHTSPHATDLPPRTSTAAGPSRSKGYSHHSSPAFALSARKPAPPALSTTDLSFSINNSAVEDDADELFIPPFILPASVSRSRPNNVDDSSTSLITSSESEELDTDDDEQDEDDDNLTNPSSVSGLGESLFYEKEEPPMRRGYAGVESRTVSRTTSCSVTAGQKLMGILGGSVAAPTTRCAEPDALWASRGRMNGRLVGAGVGMA